MSDENNSDSPPRNAEQNPPPNPPPKSAIEQAEVSEQGKPKTEDDPTITGELRREFKWFEMASLFIQAALAVIGIWALCIYSGQLNVMRGQLKQMRDTLDQMKEQTKAAHIAAVGSLVGGVASSAQAETSAKALTASDRQSKASLDAAIDSLQKEQRAWIGLSSFSVEIIAPIINIRPPRNSYTARATLVNSGRSPARGVEAIIGLCTVPNGTVFSIADEVWMDKLIDLVAAKSLIGIDYIEARKKPFGFTPQRSAEMEVKEHIRFDDSLAPPWAQHPETIIVPKNVSYGSVAPGLPFNFQSPNGWMIAADSTTVIYGRVQYKTVFECTQDCIKTTSFCAYQRAGAEEVFSACPIHNDVK
jgi:hypothetical protein